MKISTIACYRSIPATGLLAAALLLGGCGGDDADGGGAKPVRPVATAAAAQEVWIPYHHPAHAKGAANNPDGHYTPPPPKLTKKKARQLANHARTQAASGRSIGNLAWQFSHAPWGALGGYTGALPAEQGRPLDARERAVLALGVGEMSDVYEWRHGFGFAQRIDEEQAQRLARRARHANRTRARARVVHIHHENAYPQRFEFDKVTKEQAIAAARDLIAKVQKGADFAKIAATFNNAERLRRTSGLLVEQGSDWVTWRSRAWGYDMLEVVLEEAPVGRVMPEPLVSFRGVDVVFVLERH